MKPTLGRIVHFVVQTDNGIDVYAGIITRVQDDWLIDMVTFGPNSIYHNHNVKFSEEYKPGYWSWPPRV